MVTSANEIAVITGLGTTFIGTTLVAAVTSLPELVTTLAAVKIGADDMAIGNLFGSNMFNMFALGLTDVFYTPGRFLGAIDPSFLLVGMLGLLMTGLGLIGNLARLEKRIWSSSWTPWPWRCCTLQECGCSSCAASRHERIMDVNKIKITRWRPRCLKKSW